MLNRIERALCPLAGATLVLGSLALAGISGVTSFQGFSSSVPIPFFGWVGPTVSVMLVALGIGASVSLQSRSWASAAVMALTLLALAYVERTGTWMALQGQVEAAEQADADRSNAFLTATEALASTRAEIAGLQGELELMASDRILDAQTRLAALGLYAGRLDGQRGEITLGAMRTRGAELRERIAALQGQERELLPVVQAGAPVAEHPFNAHMAELYATGLTVLSIVLAFLAPFVAGLGARVEAKDYAAVADALEQEANAALRDVIDFRDYLRA